MKDIILLTERQQQELITERLNIIKAIGETTDEPFRLLDFTYYPESKRYGCTVYFPNGLLYYGRGDSISNMLADLLFAIDNGEYVLCANTIKNNNLKSTLMN